MIELYTWLLAEFQTNQFLLGFTVPILMTALVYSSRSFVLLFYKNLKRCFSSNITINTDDQYYHQLDQFIFEKYTLQSFRRNANLTNKGGKISVGAGYGVHFGLIHGSPTFILKTQVESQSDRFKEMITITTLSFRPTRIMELIQDDFQAVLDNRDSTEISLYMTSPSYGGKQFICKKPKRSMDTLILDQSIKNQIVTYLDDFQNSKESCESSGTPWHAGIMLHGEPGTGKSSLAHIIASMLSRDIHYHSKGELHDSDFDEKTSILVLEDIDASNISTDREASTKTSNMSDVLNFIDGPLTPHGMILIATTNHLENLDPALIRKGRFDLILELPKRT